MRARRYSARHGACVLALLAGCTTGGATDLPDAATGARAPTGSAATSSAAAGTSSANPPVDAPTDDWRQAIRTFQYQRAWELLEALPDKDKPEIRLARGRIAAEIGRHADAVEALEGLDSKLPSVGREIRQWYAQAAFEAGPHDAAARLLEASATVRDLLVAAQAWLRAGQPKKARAVADKAVKRAQRIRRKSEEAEAHLVRAAIAESTGAKAVAARDFRWFVQHRTRDPRVRDAIAGVDRLGGRLTLQERIDALAGSCDASNLEDTLKVFDNLAEKKGIDAMVVKLGRARAIYRARDYARARDAYLAVAASPSGHGAEARYYAARSTARTGDQRAAADMYAAMVKRYRNNGWAERAAYRLAETLLLLGRFDEAAKAFARYSSRFGRTSYASRARYGRAVALLSAGKPKSARKLFAGLRKGTRKRRHEANLRHLEGLAAWRAGDSDGAKKLWLGLIREQPLTFPALAAHARLAAIGHAPLPPLMPKPRSVAFAALPLSLPAGPALLSSLGLDASAEQRLATMEQEAAQRYPGRESEALCEMYGMIEGARRRHQIGSRAVSLDMLMRPPTAAERWAWRCVYPYPFAQVVQREERRYGLPNGIVYSVMRQESAFRATAVSPVGAQGLMQLMPNTARRAAAEADYDAPLEAVQRPDVNVRLGSFYLSKLLRNFGGNVALATAGYNAGPHAVQRWLDAPHERETDLWVARIPFHETRSYVQQVLGNFARYQWLAGGTANVTPLDLVIPADTDIGEKAY